MAFCPNCARGYDAGASECEGCGVVFAKWRARAAAPARSSGAEPMEAWHDRRIAVTIKRALALVVVLLILWLCARPPDGRPVPPEALADPSLGFAVTLPPDWVPAERDAVIGGRILALRAVPPQDAGWLEAFVVTGPDLPEVSGDSSALDLATFTGAVVAGAAQDFRSLPGRYVKVDGLKSLRLSGNATRRAGREVQAAVEVDPWVQRRRAMEGLPPAPVAYVTKVVEESTEVKFAAQSVPGAGRRYGVAVVGAAAAFDTHKAEVDAFLESFRVTQRPLSPAHIAAIVVANLKNKAFDEAVWALLAMLLAGFGWAFNPLRE